ncbi:MAG: hypothetical protein QGH20_01205 [Candidatus Latescibacteria bacterium]|nr:hypothetical protein [Candidatus Latescibacterota bacterium]
MPTMTPVRLPQATSRLFAMSAGGSGALYFGSSPSPLYRYAPFSGTLTAIATPLTDLPISASLALGHRVYILSQKSPTIAVYDTEKDDWSTINLPHESANVWYGIVDEARQSLWLIDRSNDTLMCLNCQTESVATFDYPYDNEIPGVAIGLNDGHRLLLVGTDPCGVGIFDRRSERFSKWIGSPWPEIEPTGVVPIPEDRLLIADRLRGRLAVYHLKSEIWERPIEMPDHGSVYGFIGMGLPWDGGALFCLSTYQGTMRYDRHANSFVSTGSVDSGLGVDGLPYHFMDRYLAFDPSDESVSYLAIDDPMDSYTQLCYGLVHDGHLYVTGNDIYDSDTRVPDGGNVGPMTVWQSFPPQETT